MNSESSSEGTPEHNRAGQFEGEVRFSKQNITNNNEIRFSKDNKQMTMVKLNTESDVRQSNDF